MHNPSSLLRFGCIGEFDLLLMLSLELSRGSQQFPPENPAPPQTSLPRQPAAGAPRGGPPEGPPGGQH